MNTSSIADSVMCPESGELVLRIHRAALATDPQELEFLRSWTTEQFRSPLKSTGDWSVLHVQLPMVRYLNSLGLSFFYRLAPELQRHRRRLRISIAADGVLRVARFCRFHEFADLQSLNPRKVSGT